VRRVDETTPFNTVNLDINPLTINVRTPRDGTTEEIEFIYAANAAEYHCYKSCYDNGRQLSRRRNSQFVYLRGIVHELPVVFRFFLTSVLLCRDGPEPVISNRDNVSTSPPICPISRRCAVRPLSQFRGFLHFCCISRAIIFAAIILILLSQQSTGPYEPLEGTYFGKDELPKGPLTDIKVIKSSEPPDFTVLDNAGFLNHFFAF
jgi:hypothetical protein